ncbi:cyclin-dependent kinase-like 2 (nucleomorph) [Cryptomonas paramecium]|uniref:cyclin-dependent kinase n=1 Tax=Cryptomonas paramaecium TaxID=2898 RepID=F2HI88_9CRYP|nr:cyclin-dependent kinase-like 2 [Cryptomonas paramecium]AEA39012.1 cyclin-dependent kinase-like 2 [Cryptomonas paramecium]|mmetsp:Transcript_36645/g.96593  ORF Transcript_36645/g.96593 Transcript_36645/m.96593 type:complete len:301 (-) Transcript_36645:15818-16720(-)
MENYRKTEILGQGAYGKVFKGQDLRSGQIVALKRALATNEEEGIPSTTLREISVLRTVSECEYVVKLLDVISSKTKSGKSVLYIIFQYLDCDLRTFIISNKKKNNGLHIKLIKHFVFQLLLGLKHCHDQGIVHRDLKPQNILIENAIRIKIADFGLSRNFCVPVGRYTHEVVTLWYRPPEILLGVKCYSTSVDIWAVGCIMAEMILGRPIFCGESEIEQILAIFKILGTPSVKNWPSVYLLKDWHEFPQWKSCEIHKLFKGLDSDGIRLLCSFLHINPSKRANSSDSIESVFFDDIRDFY